MKRRIQFVCLIGYVFWQAWCLGMSGLLAAPASKEACLNCHGPFDKLATSTSGYASPSGEKTTPHRYVPHGAKEGKAIPECSNCHQPHSVPPSESNRVALQRREIDWCYSSCHHDNTLKSCKECHPEKK